MEMFDTLENIVQKAQTLQQDVLSGQANFLEILPIDDPAADLAKTHHKEWHENKMLEHEREVLGFYMTGHPLARFVEELENYTTTNLLEVLNMEEKLPLRVGGIIKKVKMLFTKKNDKMAVFELEDLKGEIPVVVFSDRYSNPDVANLVRADQSLIVCVQLDRRRAEPQIIMDRIIPLEQARERLTQSVHIHIKTVGLEQDFLDKLKTLLAKYPGVCPVQLHLSTPHQGEVVVGAGVNMKVAASLTLRQEVEALLGKGTVIFKA
jgi:DNA polymerase-3 subunit alpha